jgi:hypothetical protein
MGNYTIAKFIALQSAVSDDFKLIMLWDPEIALFRAETTIACPGCCDFWSSNFKFECATMAVALIGSQRGLRHGPEVFNWDFLFRAVRKSRALGADQYMGKSR